MTETELLIEPTVSSRTYWADLWRYRGLLLFLTWRDIILRYKQTTIGIAWAVVPSLATAGAFTLIFGKFAKLSSGGVPYPVFVLAATLPWNLFAAGFSQGGNSLVANSHLISKVYFPRLVIPLSSLLVSLIDFGVAALLLVGALLWCHVTIRWRVVGVLPFLGLALLSALGVGLWVAALQVRYRDFRYIIPLFLQLGLYASPVGFSSVAVPESWRLWYSLNPMVGVIDGFRWALLGGSNTLFPPAIALSAALSILLFTSGVFYFRRMEGTFADLI